MKMRKKLAALLAAAMIASIMPMSAFAASRNRVEKVVTVEKDTAVKAGQEPDLRIKLDDEITTTQSFYLHLDGAEWLPVNEASATTDDLVKRFPAGKAAQKIDAAGAVVKDIFNFGVVYNGDQYVFEAHREGSKTLAVRLVERSATATTAVTGNETGNDMSTVITPNVNPNLNFEFKFPMAAKIKDAEAKVAVQMYDTTITNTEHLFAVSDTAKAKIVVGSVPGFYRSTEIADIKLEELYANSLKDVTDQEERWFTLELRNTDFTFNIDETKAQLVGERAYRNGTAKKLTTLNKNYTLSADKTRLAVKIDDTILAGSLNERGNIVLKGVEIVATRDARNGDVEVVMESKKLFDKETVTVAKHGEYATKLSVPKDWKYEVVAGTEKEVEFILSEELANSLVGQRPVTFTFDQGVKIKTNTSQPSDKWEDYKADNILWSDYSNTQANRIKALLLDIARLEAIAAPTAQDKADLLDAKTDLISLLSTGSVNSGYKRPGVAALTGAGIVAITGDKVATTGDNGKWSDTELNKRVHIADNQKSFTVDNFVLVQDKAGKYTFKTTLLVPANVTGDITVEVTGKGVTEEKITILKAEAPVTVEANTMDIKVGLKEIETTGKITIKETAKERISQGKNINIRIADIDSGLKIKSFKATVVEGDLVLEDRKDTDIAIGVKRVSTEPSTIEITDIVMSTDRTVPEGKYDLVIGGNAISSITGRREFSKEDHYDIDPVAVVKDFINITTKNTEDISGSANKAKVQFVIGASQYLVNGVEQTMDAAAYAKDGRTMVPVRYVAAALGITGDKVVWDGPNQAVTIIADKTIQVKLGSKMMLIDGVSVPMSAAAEAVSGRVFVPVAEIARGLGVTVAWDSATQTATFN